MLVRQVFPKSNSNISEKSFKFQGILMLTNCIVLDTFPDSILYILCINKLEIIENFVFDG
ncbi:unnamed protein product (macronuclear) [Paramecium tetraurelia]|uniref:Uncharacterized protein n=1 Tax=Paramecium tetraurelia TaxID=5888 RepID=A0CAY8_PARTE|nr:uncharacterized protein GSPATT00036738001 [Paramecium tetraurelia]CAK67955.1 unnamed protein product [Paramecium tetraurelia]|eukprot:XP_001435352.1 hypothetical protein (macronuclear) [Paramecium tetraurelia strain d4-2]